MDRRAFLKTCTLAPLVLAAGGRAFAAPGAGSSRFLLVFLRGGYDAANLLVPYRSDFYYASRPTIAIPPPDPERANAAIALDADWALHPALRDTIAPLWRRGECLFVPFAGTADLSRSHFETQNHIELGDAENGSRRYDSGFLNRLAAELGGTGMAFTSQLPLAFKGPARIANVALGGALGQPLAERQQRQLAALYAGTALARPVEEGMALRADIARTFDDEMQAASRGAIGAGGFELEARRMARLMRDDPRAALGFIDVGGWDTHVNQGGAEGALAGRLKSLGAGLAAYADAMGPAWRNAVVVVISEFGRTFRENGSRGTDHGHGSVYWVLGGALNGKGVDGRQVAVTADTLFQDRDYPVLNDYRSLLGHVFRRQFGLDGAALSRVFPGVPRAEYRFL